MLQMQNETDFTHQDDYDYAKSLYKIVMKMKKREEDFANDIHRSKDSDGNTIEYDDEFDSSDDSPRNAEDEQKPKTDDHPELRKDTERSTWWMADTQKNRKMTQWMKNLNYQEERMKQKKFKIKI